MNATAPSRLEPEPRPRPEPRPSQVRIARGLGWLGALTALAIAPPIAERTYALGPLLDDMRAPMWAGSLLGAAGCALLARTLAPRRPAALALLVPLLALVWLEIGIRAVLHLGAVETRGDMVHLALRTFPEQSAQQPHPFLQFTARTDIGLRGNASYGELPRGNALGFFGELPERHKPAGTVRIACLGGSTTARGYPRRLQRILREAAANDPTLDVRFEVLNFGLGYWTSAHSLVNYMLNVVHYEPDYVVVLHGWNDERALHATRAAFRTDYSHVFKEFAPPLAPDRWPIRTSVLYRWLAARLDPTPSWTSMLAATTRPFPHSRQLDAEQYAPYVSNLRSIAQLAALRGSTPVLVTMPHCTDETIPFHANSAESIAAFAGITRLLHRSELAMLGPLVDLDAEVTGKRNELFVDVGHMTDPGMELKAQRVADAILGHLGERR